MPRTFTPSVNILRDTNKPLDYIVTSNAKRVYDIISRNYQSGNRAFTVLGTYGSGKSAFLWAFERHLKKEAYIFGKDFNGIGDYAFIKIVAAYQSCLESVASALKLTEGVSAKDIIDFLEDQKNDVCRVIIIDEFGKLLEHAGKNNPEEEMYFIQQLAEYAADPENQLLLITTLHQSFDAYAISLGKSQRNEWEKVKGRLTEIAFNEPVEQLLYIASNRIKQNQENSIPKKKIQFLTDFCQNYAISSLHLLDYKQLAESIYPLEIASGSVLVQSLQRYGQNERSLFTFLDSESEDGLLYFAENHPKQAFYSLDQVYDYLNFNFYSVLTSYYNPDYYKWSIIKESIDRTIGHLPEYVEDSSKILKTIGLLNIFSPQAAKVNHEFLVGYGKTALGIKNSEEIIQLLEQHRIIRYIRFKDSFILFEGTDFNIEKALRNASKKVDPVLDIVPRLKKEFDLPPLPAKNYFYKTGTPRYFKFEFSTEVIDSFDDLKYDGCINIIFQDSKPEQIPNIADNSILYGWYPKTEELRTIIHELDTAQFVLDQIVDDSIAKREIKSLQHHLSHKLNSKIFDLIYYHPDQIEWYFMGSPIRQIKNTTTLNQFLSLICEKYAYRHTPIFRSELVNRTKLQSPISLARKRLLEALVEHWQEEDLAFAPDKFPPEKTIYLSLIKGNLHDKLPNGTYGFSKPKEESFKAIWDSGEQFLDSTREQARPLYELIKIWRNKPFGLKQGFIDFWLPVYLFIKRSEFALYLEGRFMPELNPDNFDIIFKSPQKITLKCFELAGERLSVFNKFRELLQLKEEDKLSQEGFVETIKPYLTFYKDLPRYTQTTRALTSKTKAFRETIRKAKDPEKTFFEDLPAALGYTIHELSISTIQLEAFAKEIKNAVRELREVYPELLTEIESQLLYQLGISGDLGYKVYKDKIADRYKALKVHLLSSRQKTFYTRLTSPIDDRNSWLASIGQVVLGKNPEKIQDQDREVLSEKLGYAIRSLDNLLDVIALVESGDEEDVLHIQVTSLKEGLKESVLKLPTVDKEALRKLKSDLIKHIPKQDPALALVSLTQLIQELLTDEES